MYKDLHKNKAAILSCSVYLARVIRKIHLNSRETLNIYKM